MAEVMQPMIQSSNSMTMLQSRPASADAFQAPNASQSYQQQQRGGQTPRNVYNPHGQYRGPSAPVQAYAFQSTPHLRQETRTLSAPSTHTQSTSMSANIVNNARHGFAQPSPSSSGPHHTSPSPSQLAKRSPTKADFQSADRPSSFISLSSSIPDLSLTNFDSTPKASPDRYRRSARRTDSNNSIQSPSSATPSGSGMSSVEHLYTPPPAPLVRTASDDLQSTKASESAKRYRRRSAGNLDGSTTPSPPPGQAQRPASSQGVVGRPEPRPASSTIRPVSHYERSASSESLQGRGGRVTPPTQEGDAARSRQASPPVSPAQQGRRDSSPVRVPARGSSEANKRMAQPSPLSQSAYPRDEQSPPKPVAQKVSHASSPAAQHLAALSDKDLNKGMKSRLRRAFSFGSAAELRKASGENAPPSQFTQRPKTSEEVEQEQDEIAQRQEAAGIGAGIYSGQGGFAGSTDNLSISSTASSASIMLRKMGKGMKKSGRSIKGLFRPKSVIGVPAADGPVQPSQPQVSMVTVEAERQKVNVNANAADQTGGGTGFPKLERNSVDVPQPAVDGRSSNERNDSMRKSIVGSDKDRADVLAAVRKGILKRSGTGSPTASPIILPQVTPFTDPLMTRSPSSSLPATPRDERQSRSLTSTTSTSSNDYFSNRANGATKSMPATPGGNRNISFSPRIQFHDVWSATEYDRRGEIATCNRLTPMLAQQIKEELNTFKMEMEVHEQSKPHTHFF